MSKEDGGPAFPVIEFDQQTGQSFAQHMGMTLRDYLAAKALAGMLAGESDANGLWKAEDCAFRAYRIAEAMLKAR